MAIVIEDENPKSAGIVGLIGWVVILITIGAIIYFLFFKRPDLISVGVPGDVQRTEEIAKVNIDPDSVMSNPAFNARQPYTPPGLGTSGRSNPFEPF